MKRVFKHPTAPATGRKYWRSLEQLAETPEFNQWIEREFPQGAAEFHGGEVSRRHFLKIMGASTALAGVGFAGCRRPELHLVPFTKNAEWAIPGKPLFYATSMPSRAGYMPLIATTHDGRPTKLEGNPIHPINGGHGGTDVFAQAAVLDLYDPDRSRAFLSNGSRSESKKFDEFFDQLVQKLPAGGDAGLAFLVEEDNSPTRERLRGEIEKRYPGLRWCVYEPLGAESAASAAEIGYGVGTKVMHRFENADVILALDSDFLGCEPGNLAGVKAFSARRRVENAGDKMNRLYVVENRYTITGGMADHRLRCPASQIGAFALALAERIGTATKDANLTKFYDTLGKTQAAAKFTEGWVEGVAEDLMASRGRSLVVAGARQPVAVQLLVAAINSALGNIGQTVLGAQTFTKPAITIAELARDLNDGKVSTLFILGGNPVYNAPADLEWGKAQRMAKTVVHLGDHETETSKEFCTWHVPRAHFLEAWRDGRSSDGTYVSVQPMILPLFGGWSDLEILARIAGRPKTTGPELIQETFRALAGGGDFNAAWNKLLHDGFFAGSAPAPRALTFAGAGATAYISENASLPAAGAGDMMEVVFTADATMDDGRHNNNGWLQEAPDPITKLTWDNAALLSPATAKKLGVRNYEAAGDMIEIAIDDRKIEAPVYVAPGHADDSISISLGYGRTVTGRVGIGTGVNAYPLRTTTAPYFAFAKVQATGKRGVLAITQAHWSMEGRGLVREGTVEQYGKNPEFAQRMGMDAELPAGGNPSLYSHPFEFKGPHQWGMAIDLNTCLGCNACVVACQAENNSPIVGKEQVINGREMHWIRMDRYFASTDESDPDPEMVTQPMLCQQCENAPCETVCPVNATVHSEEGLNVMAYNRCIGTRYCANNCPFKVRRFNFFNYNERPIENGQLYLGPLTKKGTPDTIKMQKNPNVTVRIRGVMEKCTFCVQRIQEAKIAAKVRAGASDDVKIPTDAFQVACQQACANESIVFGNIADPESKVSKLRKNDRGYRLLDYLNVNSRIKYLARLRNPNMKMPGADKIGDFDGNHAHGEEGHDAAPEKKHSPDKAGQGDHA